MPNMTAAAGGTAMNASDIFRCQVGDDWLLAKLELEGLIAALEGQIREFVNITGLECDSVIDMAADSFVPEGPLAAAALRIFQETLLNVARHARATAVRIRIRLAPGLLQMDVTDNGMGAVQDSFDAPHSRGVAGMRLNARRFGGSLHIVSVPGGGTHVCLRLPLGQAGVPP